MIADNGLKNSINAAAALGISLGILIFVFYLAVSGVTEAAAILNVSPQYIRIGLQQQRLPIGTAVKMSSIWTYNISPKLLAEYCGRNVIEELAAIRG